jgi:predicted lipid-binding transport protein (Tim44 family)
MTSDQLISLLKTVASVLFSLSFVALAVWNGARELAQRRKTRGVREWLESAVRLDARWKSPDELIATARQSAQQFFEAFNAMDDERLRALIHPTGWEEFQRDLARVRANAQERHLMSFEIQKTLLWHVDRRLDVNEQAMVVQLDLVGRYETWNLRGLKRSRYSSVKEFWEFRTHLQEWRIFNRRGAIAWMRFARRPLPPMGPM